MRYRCPISALAAVAGLAFVALAGPAKAQTYPVRPISVVVPFAAGSATDTVARLVGAKMAERLGQPLVMENAPGAGGTIAAARAARAAPDGYTILIHTTIALSAVLYRSLPYDTATAFEPLGMINIGPYVLAAKPAFPASDGRSFLDRLKTDGPTISFAHAGPGTGSHLCALMLMQALDVKPNLVPYRSTSLALNDVMGGQVDMMCDQTTNAFPHMESKAVRPYAITSPARHPRFPDLPTTAELGIPTVDATIWHGLYAPKGTPAEVVSALHAALQFALDDPTVVSRLGALGTDLFSPDQRGRDAHARRLASELIQLKAVVQKAGVQLD